MLFSSLPFLLFFMPLFFLLYFTLKKRSARNTLLLVFSLVFYAWGEPFYILLMLFSIAVNYALAILINKSKNDEIKTGAKPLLVIDIAINLALIGVFKYSGFIIGSFNAVTTLSLPVPELALPIGISFYTFQIMSYVIDVYRGDTKVQYSVINLGAYLAAFPQLIAGPIVRYQTVAEELDDRTETVADFADGMRRFIAGLAKKVLIANVMAETADTILGYSGAEYGVIGAWIAVLAYTLQIYFDFSGYSDMAIGMGRMMGFHYLENFNYPYIATSVTDFWRRWHISLSTFFRDYVYIPLGGNRCSKPRWVYNMAVVWLLTGLWHGASWNFVLWGAYFGVILVCEKLIWGKYIDKIPVVNHIYAAVCFIFGWVIFRAESVTQIIEITKAMFGGYALGGNGTALPILLQSSGFDLTFIVTFIIGTALALSLWNKLKPKIFAMRFGPVVCDVAAIAALAACIVSLAIGAYNPFIYFRF